MDFNNNIVKYSAILSAMGVLYFLLTSYLLYSWPMTFAIIYLVIYIYMIVMFGRAERAVRGDIFPFAEAFKSVLIIMVVSAIVTLIFQFIWANVIDTSLPEKIVERTIESTTQMLESFGTPEDAIDSGMEGIEEGVMSQYTVVGLLKSIFWGFLASAVMAAIISFFIKKDETFA